MLTATHVTARWWWGGRPQGAPSQESDNDPEADSQQDGRQRVALNLFLHLVHRRQSPALRGMRRVTGQFAAFTGFVTRDPVVSEADFVIESFEELAALVLN